MKYKTKITLECSYGLGQAWELQEETIEHDVVLPYKALREAAIKAVGGLYVTYGAMTVVGVEEEFEDES